MNATVVTTVSGQLLGRVEAGIHTFLGVPYAAAPFGPDRLRPPRPVEPWGGLRAAIAFGAEPPQLKPPADHPAAAMVWDPAEPGEDCLNLNVWTPDPGASGLPVMVWIPGGMFEVGTGATYDGSRFARDGIVCLTINYRVGPEGFLYLADGEANLGLQDQVAALEWVRENIAAFGGDPANVTIFGESAGAMSVGTLLAMPRAEGLFRRAICQSGAADRVIPAATALAIGRELAERLGIEATRDAFAAIAPDRLLFAAAELKGDLVAHPDPSRWSLEVIASMLPWQPVMDGDVIPGHPVELVAAGAAAGVDVMVGSNIDDWTLVVAANGSFGRVTDETLAGPVIVHGFETALAYGLTAREVDAYRAAYPGAGPGQVLAAIETDGGAACRPCGLPRPTLRPHRARTCTSSHGPRPDWVPATPWRSASCSTPWTWGPARCSGRCWWVRRSPSPTRCTGPGSPLQRRGTRAGRGTGRSGGRRCASTPSRGSSTIPGRSSGGCWRPPAGTGRRSRPARTDRAAIAGSSRQDRTMNPSMATVWWPGDESTLIVSV